MSDQRVIRICGLVGIAGAGILLASDWLMMGTLTDARHFANEWLTILAKLPAWRVRLGALIGPLGAWLYVIGFWQVYLALRPAGKWLAFVCWAGFSIGFIYAAGAFHASFPFMAHAAQSMAAVDSDRAEVVTALSQHSIRYAGLIFLISWIPSLVGCLTLAYAVLARRTRYPRWSILFHPLVLYVFTLTFRFVPAPLGGLLYIGFGNIIFLIFFAASTIVLWHHRDAEPGNERVVHSSRNA
jgi:hypothetical protein